MTESGAVEAPVGRWTEVSAGAVWSHRCGSGGPPVVFLPGGGMLGLYYWQVHNRAAEFTTSVIYDRLGTGWSEVADLPRSGARVTGDLHELLAAMELPGPVVLVGHSLGGLYARLYAKRFPGAVAGLVLLDPTHEDIVGYLPRDRARQVLDPGTDDPFPPERLDAMRSAYRCAFGRALTGWPPEIREPLLERGFSRIGYRQSMRESLNLPRLFAEVRDAGPEPEVPLILVSAMGVDAVTEELIPPEARAALAESSRTKHRLYTDLAAAHPRSRLRRLDEVGHSSLAWGRPDEVIDAIRTVTAAV